MSRQSEASSDEPADLDGEGKARQVADMFTRIVPRYDLMNTLMTFGLDASWRKLTVASVLPADPAELSEATALDVAAGTGELTFALSRAGVKAAVGLDFTPAMVEAARAKAERRGDERVSFVVGDALALPFADESFDAATVGFGLRNVADLPRAIVEMRRVLRPGGLMACLEMTHPPSVLVRWAFRPFFHGLVPLIGGLVSGDPAAYRYLPESVERFPNARDLARLMTEAGLTRVRYRYLGLGTVALHLAEKRSAKQT